MSETPSRTEPSQRAQTVQDFAIGVGVFLLAVAFAFSVLPVETETGESERVENHQYRSERLANAVLSAYGTGNHPNELNGTALRSANETVLEERLGVRSAGNVRIDSIRLSIETLEETTEIFRYGDTGPNLESAATVERLVTFERGDRCSRGCRLIVRSWT